jgi:hypothetical protein
MALKKPGGQASIEAHVELLAASPWGRKHPTLLEMLSATTYEAGEARQPATLTVFIEDGFVKLCLNDRDCERTGWVAAETLEEASKVLESKLVNNGVEWRKAWSGRGGTRKK